MTLSCSPTKVNSARSSKAASIFRFYNVAKVVEFKPPSTQQPSRCAQIGRGWPEAKTQGLTAVQTLRDNGYPPAKAIARR